MFEHRQDTHGSTTLLPQLAMFSFESFEHAVAKSIGSEGNAVEGGLPTSEQASGCVCLVGQRKGRVELKPSTLLKCGFWNEVALI